MKKRSRQREAVLGSIRRAEGPLSVAEIHERAGREAAGIGIATVYRALKSLMEAGEVAAVELPGGETLYEPTGRGHHHHFRCRSCWRVFELHVCPVGMPAGTTLPGGYVVEDHDLTLYGRCAGCVGGGR